MSVMEYGWLHASCDLRPASCELRPARWEITLKLINKTYIIIICFIWKAGAPCDMRHATSDMRVINGLRHARFNLPCDMRVINASYLWPATCQIYHGLRHATYCTCTSYQWHARFHLRHFRNNRHRNNYYVVGYGACWRAPEANGYFIYI